MQRRYRIVWTVTNYPILHFYEYYTTLAFVRQGAKIILAGRRLNDGMGAYVAGEVVKLMLKAGKPVRDSKALMLGITFKEIYPVNCAA